MSALFLLMRDHLELSRLLRRLQQGPAEERGEVLEALQRCWSAHVRAAAMLLPAVESWAGESLRTVTEQHTGIGQLLGEVAAAGLDQPRWEALRCLLDEHMQEEQGRLLPEAKRRLQPDVLSAIARRIQEERSAEAALEGEEAPEQIVEAMATVAEALSQSLDSVLEIGGARKRRPRRRALAPAPETGAAPRARRRP